MNTFQAFGDKFESQEVFSFVSCCFDKTVNTPIGERKGLLYLVIKGSQGRSLRQKKPGGKN